MKLLLVIDHLGLGGAQRQLAELACGLQKRGHKVEVFNYFPHHDFFRARLEASGIAIHDYRKGKGFSFGVLWRLARLIRRGSFDVVVSYLNSPNIYNELARLVATGPKLIVSERCSHHDERSALVGNARRSLHVLSDHVVTNSQTHAEWLRRKWWLSDKTSCIYNGVDLSSLQPTDFVPQERSALRLLAVGRICPQKNILNLINGLEMFYDRNGYAPSVSWAGKPDAGADGESYAGIVSERLARTPAVGERWSWMGEQADMPRLLREHHALIHPSLYEGLPNSVCEALAAGRPVLVSSVGDHPLLVADGERGFLFDPLDPVSIAAAIEKLMALGPKGWISCCRNARQYAEANLDVAKMVGTYEDLFIRLVERRDAGVGRTREI